MRGVAERAIHRQAIQDREFARALAELVVDVMEERGAVPPSHEFYRRAG